MGIKSKRHKGTRFAVIALFFLVGCAPAARLYMPAGGELRQSDLEQIIAENPLGISENIKITTLDQGESVSHHIVQVRDREAPHIHKTHDGTVIIMKGRGYLVIENRRMDLSVGDVIHIPAMSFTFTSTLLPNRALLWLFFLHLSTAKTTFL